MKNFLIIIFFILGLTSTFVTILDIISNRYLREFHNYRSLKNKDLFMTRDSIIVQNTHERNPALEDHIKYDIQGTLKSNGQPIKINARNPKYVNVSLNLQPVYKSKLTGDVFMNVKRDDYYKEIFRGIYFSIFLKCYFIVMIFSVLYYLYKKRKYRL